MTLCRVTSIAFRSADPLRIRGAALVFRTYACPHPWMMFAGRLETFHPESSFSISLFCQTLCCRLNGVPIVFGSFASFFRPLRVSFKNKQGSSVLFTFSHLQSPNFHSLIFTVDKASFSLLLYSVAYSIMISKLDNDPIEPPPISTSVPTRGVPGAALRDGILPVLPFRVINLVPMVSHLTEGFIERLPPNVKRGIYACSSDTSSSPRLSPREIHPSPLKHRRGAGHRRARRN